MDFKHLTQIMRGIARGMSLLSLAQLPATYSLPSTQELYDREIVRRDLSTTQRTLTGFGTERMWVRTGPSAQSVSMFGRIPVLHRGAFLVKF